MHCELTFFSQTDVGKLRHTNQDSFGFDPKGHYFVLADGMGGHKGGEIASAMAVHLCLDGLEELVVKQSTGDLLKEQLLSLLERVNLSIIKAGNENPLLQGMGSTIVLGLKTGNILHYCHVGDSRLYLLRKGLLQPLTQDHSLQQEMIENHPEEIRTIQRDVPTNIVTQALGVSADLNPSYAQLTLQNHDLLMASSDGLHGAMDHLKLEELTRKNTALSSLSNELVTCANRLDGSDNISVLLARIKIRENPVSSLWRNLQQFLSKGFS
jgi:protein phosphatase